MNSFENSIAPTKFVERYIYCQQRQSAAVRSGNLDSANRWLIDANDARDRLAKFGPEGRRQIEVLLEHPMPAIRLGAAISALNWAANLAVPVLGRLLSDDLSLLSIDERIELRHEASTVLCRHFGVHDLDAKRLVDPLRAYGIELPQSAK